MASAILLAGMTLWSLGTPLFAAPDEPAQILRAVSVARGELYGDPVAGQPAPVTAVQVPAGYAGAGQGITCFIPWPTEPAGCDPALHYRAGLATAETYVGRYPPLYYLLVGGPSRVLTSPGPAIYAMRELSGLWSSVLLGLAVALAWQRRRRLLAGLLVALTPQVMFLAAVVSPSGLAISAAVCAWTSGLILLDDPRRREVLASLTVSLLLLILDQALSPLWAVTVVGFLWVWAGPGHSRRPSRSLAGAAVACVGVGGGAVVLTFLHQSWRVMPSLRQVTGPVSEWRLLWRGATYLPGYLAQAVGAMGWLESRPPLATYVLWSGALTGLLILAGAFGRRRQNLLLVVLMGASVLLPVVLSSVQARHQGYVWQARDGMPLWAGVPLVAATLLPALGPRTSLPALDHRLAFWMTALAVRIRHARSWLTGTVVTALAFGQFMAFATVLHRYTSGSKGPWNPLTHRPGSWTPPVGSALLDLLFALVMATAVVLLTRSGWGTRVVPSSGLNRQDDECSRVPPRPVGCGSGDPGHPRERRPAPVVSGVVPGRG